MKVLLTICVALLCTACTPSEYSEALRNCKQLQVVTKDVCLQELAVQYSTTEPCKQIRLSGVRIPCMVEVAKNTCDTSLCQDITESWQQTNCVTQVELSAQCI
jgi:hypothetical protein